MKKSIIALSTLLFLLAAGTDLCSFSTPDVVYLRVHLDRSSPLAQALGKEYDVTGAGKRFLDLIVPRSRLEELTSKVPSYEIIYRNQRERLEKTVGPDFEDYFHDYDEMVQTLSQTVQDHPDIVTLDTLGFSVEQRLILAAKVSDNPHIEEDEPEFRVLSLHHGDEMMSTEIALALLEHLTDGYGNDPLLTALIDDLEIWIIPMMNPDGRMAVPLPIRWNANGVDLNRDYGYMWNSDTPAPFSQPETRAVRDNGIENTFVLSLSFHSMGDIVNYVWNYSATPPPDAELVEQLSAEYGSLSGYWVFQGYDWYQTYGDCNDWSYGSRSSFDWTIEMAESDIPLVWDKNRNAVLTLMGHADEGIRGQVVDRDTGQPIEALIHVEELGYPVYTDPSVGDYHRLLPAGTYTVRFSAPGYADSTVTGVTIEETGATTLDVSLSRGNDNCATQVVSCFFYDPFSYPDEYLRNPTNANAALGFPDGLSASLGVGGSIVVDFGESRPIPNTAGNDFTVHEGEPADGYAVWLGEEPFGPWAFLGYGFGTTPFDIGEIGFSTARFVKIVDDNDSDPYEWYPGCDIDAIIAAPLQESSLLIYDSCTIDDSSGGDGNGRIDPGETAALTVILANIGQQEATGVTTMLSTAEPMIDADQGDVPYPPVPAGGYSSSLSPHLITVSPDIAEGSIVAFLLDIRTDGVPAASDSFRLQIGRDVIMLVDDDEGETFQTAFTEVLDRIPYGYSTWDVNTRGAPEPEDLAEFDIVLWTTGDDIDGTLSLDDRNALASFLDAGGCLYLSSQDYAYDVGLDWFATDYLHLASVENDVVVTRVDGVDGDPIADGLAFDLDFPMDFANWSDDIMPDEQARGVFWNTFYQDGDPDSVSRYSMIRADLSGESQAKTVFSVFPFEAVPSGETALTLMGRIINWFGLSVPVGIETGDQGRENRVPRTFSLQQNYPNPFNPQTTISFSVPGAPGERKHVSLLVYDIRGRLVRTLVDSDRTAGDHRIQWDGRTDGGMRAASGIYFFTLCTGGRSITKKMTLLK